MYSLNYLELFIINTISYFDLFDYPLTLSEIYAYLYTEGMQGGVYSLEEIKDCLKTSPKLQKITAASRGFYFLTGREDIIDIRLSRYNLADKKMKILLKVISWAKYIPFIKLIAACNNLAYQNAREQSDLDLFVICAKNRIWLTRFYLVALVALMGLRPQKDKTADKVCLSFYITEDSLNLEKIKIAPDDIYLVYWLATLFPLYQREDFYNKFMAANLWLKKYLPNFSSLSAKHRYKVSDNKFNSFIYGLKEKMLDGFWGNALENLAKKIQKRKMSQRKKDLAVAADGKVIVSDAILKFHENDRRLEYLEKFEKKRDGLIK